MEDYYTPGEVAERFGLTLDTLRYYEKAGLLRRVERAPSGHRRYRTDDVDLLHLVRCLRDTDMPIARLRDFAELVRDGDHTIPERLDVLQSHQRDLDARIAELCQRQITIQHKIDYYARALADEASEAVPVTGESA
ncbi:MerR family transcriptional regulator [Nocardiopsis prasina]|uniref:MerR family transcriptional regulator n=1 Tax=Nocardiopsis prasina TaxID=2015 RepID=UPI00034B4D59|nr:MerR family transcriptional regulator [Nocardiopsis prasina]